MRAEMQTVNLFYGILQSRRTAPKQASLAPASNSICRPRDRSFGGFWTRNFCLKGWNQIFGCGDVEAERNNLLTCDWRYFAVNLGETQTEWPNAGRNSYKASAQIILYLQVQNAAKLCTHAIEIFIFNPRSPAGAGINLNSSLSLPPGGSLTSLIARLFSAFLCLGRTITILPRRM